MNANSTMLIQYLEDVLGMLEQRITQHGTGYTYYWYIAAASAFLKSVLAPLECTREKEGAMNQVTRQYCRILEAQEDIDRAKDIIMPMHLQSVSTGPRINLRCITSCCRPPAHLYLTIAQINSARNLMLPIDNSDTAALGMIPTEDSQVLQIIPFVSSYPGMLTNHLVAYAIHGSAVG